MICTSAANRTQRHHDAALPLTWSTRPAGRCLETERCSYGEPGRSGACLTQLLPVPSAQAAAHRSLSTLNNTAATARLVQLLVALLHRLPKASRIARQVGQLFLRHVQNLHCADDATVRRCACACHAYEWMRAGGRATRWRESIAAHTPMFPVVSLSFENSLFRSSIFSLYCNANRLRFTSASQD